MDDELDRIDMSIEKQMRDMKYRKDELLNLNIQHIQEFVWAFKNAYMNGDMQRCGKIFDIMITLSHTKDEIPTLQEYYGGERIGRYKGTIHIDKVSEWITYIGEMIIAKTDDSVKPERIN